MRISTFHKQRGDAVTFVRGETPEIRNLDWHKIYVSSLFTYELPRTVKTINYYAGSVSNPSDIIVGGIGATLFPDFIRERSQCTIITGLLDQPNMLEPGTPPIANLVPDYDILKTVSWKYTPDDAYFCRVSKGCIRKCSFCAVPHLEPSFGYCKSIKKQIEEVKTQFGERQDLVIMDNNILALQNLDTIIREIRDEGFEKGALFNKKKRTVDFNQGIDARLITTKIAEQLSTISLSPIRLAFDYDEMEQSYREAVRILASVGFSNFTTYVMFNFQDDPQSFYNRLRINLDLSQEHNVRITGFPMKYLPIDRTDRKYASPNWRWRYIRGIQCILNATHGMVSPNPTFFETAFGSSPQEFLEIISMPDRFIIDRNKYKNGEAEEWKSEFRKLTPDEREELMTLLKTLHFSDNRKSLIMNNKKYRSLLEHYYPLGE